MRRIARLAAWLGSDWRLLVTVPALVALVFLFSVGIPSAIESVHNEFLVREFNRKQREVDERVSKMPWPVEQLPPENAVVQVGSASVGL